MIVRNDFKLSERESEVLGLLTEGFTNREISTKLCITPNTVKSHVDHIFNKLGVNSRTHAAVLAVRNNLEAVSKPQIRVKSKEHARKQMKKRGIHGSM